MVMGQIIHSCMYRHIYMTTFEQLFFLMVNEICFLFSAFSIKTYVVGTQKNRLNNFKSNVKTDG